MLNCAYCDMPCQQTREDVIPDWYNGTAGEAEMFSARTPLTGEPLCSEDEVDNWVKVHADKAG